MIVIGDDYLYKRNQDRNILPIMCVRVGRFTTFFELETCLMSEIFRITKCNDVLKFQISKMRLTPAE